MRLEILRLSRLNKECSINDSTNASASPLVAMASSSLFRTLLKEEERLYPNNKKIYKRFATVRNVTLMIQQIEIDFSILKTPLGIVFYLSGKFQV